MTSSPSSSTAVIVAGSALLAAAGLRYLAAAASFTSNHKQQQLLLLHDDDITAREVCEIYYRLLADLQLTYLELVRQIQTRVQELRAAASAGQGPDIKLQQKLTKLPAPNLLSAALRVELERALSRKQSALLAEFDIHKECLDEAVREFLSEGDGEVRRAVTTFRTFWESAALTDGVVMSVLAD